MGILGGRVLLDEWDFWFFGCPSSSSMNLGEVFEVFVAGIVRAAQRWYQRFERSCFKHTATFLRY